MAAPPNRPIYSAANRPSLSPPLRADYDAPTQMVKPRERNTRYVDAVMTVPKGTLFPMCGMNLAFDRNLVGPAMYFGLMGEGQPIGRYDDMWAGWCTKVITDHLGVGVKTGLPYLWHSKASNPFVNLRKEYKGIFWQVGRFTGPVVGRSSHRHAAGRGRGGGGLSRMLSYPAQCALPTTPAADPPPVPAIRPAQEEIIPFFQNLTLSKELTSADALYVELAEKVRKGLGHIDPYFTKLADGMLAWIECWKQLNPPKAA
jgi:hypothetical protein